MRGTARELAQRALVRAWGRRRGPVTVRVGWAVSVTSLITPRSAAARSPWSPPRGERSGVVTRRTRSALSSRRTCSAIRFGGASGSRVVGSEGWTTRREADLLVDVLRGGVGVEVRRQRGLEDQARGEGEVRGRRR